MNGANKKEPPVHQEIVDRDPELKRVRTLSRKASENAVEVLNVITVLNVIKS